MRDTTMNGIIAILCLFTAYLIQGYHLGLSITFFLVGSVMGWIWFLCVIDENKIRSIRRK